MIEITISELAYLDVIEDGGATVKGGFSRRSPSRQRNSFGFDAYLQGDVNQVTVANSQGNAVGGDQVVIANAQANLAIGRRNRQINKGNFGVAL